VSKLVGRRIASMTPVTRMRLCPVRYCRRRRALSSLTLTSCALHHLKHPLNTNQTHSAKGARNRSRGSTQLARWQQQLGIACFGCSTLNLPFPGGSGSSHLTQCVIRSHKCACQVASKSVERFKPGARMFQTTDRQTDHATE